MSKVEDAEKAVSEIAKKATRATGRAVRKVVKATPEPTPEPTPIEVEAQKNANDLAESEETAKIAEENTQEVEVSDNEEKPFVRKENRIDRLNRRNRIRREAREKTKKK